MALKPFDHAASFGADARDYARHRPRYPAELFAWIAENSASRQLAVDVATGAGQGALGLLDHFERVVAVDFSPDLLQTLPSHPRLRALAQGAENLDLGEPADVVTVFQALHWFAGEPFWERVSASLRPGGLLVVVGYAWFTVSPEVDAVLHAELLPRLGPYWSPRNQLLLDGYRDVAFPFPELAVPGFRIELDWGCDELLAYVATWSAVAGLRAAEGPDALGEVEVSVRGAWAASVGPRVTMPLSVRAFRAEVPAAC